jgi:hypothetical protein
MDKRYVYVNHHQHGFGKAAVRRYVPWRQNTHPNLNNTGFQVAHFIDGAE